VIANASPALIQPFDDVAVRQGIRQAARYLIRKWCAQQLGTIASMTPREVIDMYLDLTDEQQKEFLRMVAGMLRAEAIYGMAQELNLVERQRINSLLFEELAGGFFLFALQHARTIAKEMRDISDEEFDKQLQARVSEATATFTKAIGELEAAAMKAKRDRKPGRKIATRNIEICDLRRQDKRHWSQGRLAKKYDLDVRSIRKILNNELKWRRIAEEGRTN
jgi:hypothetical protein